MNHRYEVSYQEGDETRSVTIEASGPVDAERKFLASRPAGSVQILCVIRL